MEPLPDNWNTMTHQEKDFFFTRYYKRFIRPGEAVGLIKEADETIQKAYEEFLKENEDMLLKNHVLFRNSLQAVPHIMTVVIPNLNEKIDEYNTDFDEQFLPVTPIVNKTRITKMF